MIAVVAPGGRSGEETPQLALDGFGGELALLLSLARAHAVDLARVSLTDCIYQLAEVLERNEPTTPLAQKASWLVMAAWLVLLRSRLLLPTEAPGDALADNEADRLADRRPEFPVTQELAAWLDRRPQLGIDVFARGQPELLGTATGARYEINVVEFLWACLAQFDCGPEVDSGSAYRPLRHDLWSIRDARARLLQLLPQAPADMSLGRFLPEIPAAGDQSPDRRALRQRSAVASTLMAGLELARERTVTVDQQAPFGTITLSARTG